MGLSDAQIERYSRQIIVPRVGGHAQERLLAARIVIVGGAQEIAAPAAYLAAAGAATLAPILTGSGADAQEIASAVAKLNPDCTIDVAAAASGRATLALMIACDEASFQAVLAMLDSIANVPCVFARVDLPGRIGIFPGASPCPRCVPELLAPAAERGANAGIVAMAATAEAFKLAAGYEAAARAVLAEFDGYAAQFRALAPKPGCSCAGRPR